MRTAPDRRSRAPKRRTLRVIVVAFVLALVASLGVVTAAVAADDIPAGTSVRGVDVGGRSRAEATAALTGALGARAGQAIPVRVAGQDRRVEPQRAGLSFDTAATVEAAASAGPERLGPARRLVGGGPVEPVVRVDEAKLDRALDRLAERVHVPVGERSISFSGTTPVLAEPVAGRALDRARAKTVLREAYLREGSEPVELPTRTVEPSVSEPEARRVLEQVARPAVAAPLTLRAKGEDVAVPPSAIAQALRFEAVEGRLVPRVDGRALVAAGGLLDTLEVPAVDATFRIRNDRPVVVPARDGQDVDEAALGEAVSAVLGRGTDRVVEVPVRPTPAKLTTAEAEALGITDKLSSYTQRHEPQAYRIRNIATAARRINGTVIKPGEVFSMNETVKERTAENGYVIGKIIQGGRLTKDYGGGVSTITTAVWDAAFHAGLGRVEQKGHSYWIPKYKAGLEATVAWGQLDLKVRNDYATPVLVTAEARDRGVTISMWGRKEYDIKAEFGPRRNVRSFTTVYDPSPGCVSQSSHKGFDIDVTRVFVKDGVEVKRETFTTRYNSSDRVRCRARP